MRQGDRSISYRKAVPPGPMSTFKAQLTLILSVALIVLGAVGLVWFQKPLREERREVRREAAVAEGQVLVTVENGTNPGQSTFVITQPAQLHFFINTNGVQTDRVQLVFNIVTEAFTTPPQLNLVTGVGLQEEHSEVEQTADGFLVSYIAQPSTVGGTFATSQPTHFLTLSFTPDQTETITLNFDVENSISTVHGTIPPVDELKTIASAVFSVVEPTSPSPTPSVSPSPSPSVSPSPSGKPNVCTADA